MRENGTRAAWCMVPVVGRETGSPFGCIDYVGRMSVMAVLLQVSGLGPKLYRWLADHRILVTAGTCQGESFSVRR